MKKLLIICAILSLLSCGSRKRALDKTSEKTELSVKTDTELSVKNDVKKETETAVIVKEQSKSQEQEFTGEVADTSKPASVQTETKDGKTIQTFTNFKSVSNSTKTANKSNDSSNTTKQSEVDKSKKGLIQKAQTDIKTESAKKNVNVERKTGFPLWLLVLLIIAASAYIYLSKIKKTYNPIEWFKSLS